MEVSVPSLAVSLYVPGAAKTTLSKTATPFTAVAVAVESPVANWPVLKVTVTVDPSEVTRLPNASTTAIENGVSVVFAAVLAAG